MQDEYDTDHISESSGIKPTDVAEDSYIIDILGVGDVVKYTIPTFKVITVDLQHVVASVWNEVEDRTVHFDMFLKPGVELRVPCFIKALDSCHIPVSEFSRSVGNKYTRFSSTGVLIVWKWEPLKYDDSKDESSTEELNESSEEEPDAIANRVVASHVLTFKCIGVTKSQDYQTDLRKARDLIMGGQVVPVTLVHEPNNPRDSRALAFVCHIEDKEHTIGFVVREVVEEVHSAIDAASIVSVKFAWVRYITDWIRSGAGFFG